MRMAYSTSLMTPSRRQKRFLWTIAVLVLVAGIVGFFILPPIVRKQAEAKLSEQLGRAVSIGRVRLNPYALSATIEDFSIREKEGAGAFVEWKRLYVRFDAARSLFGEWVVGAVELDGLHVAVTVNPDGSFNFSDLLAKLAPPGAAPSAPSKPGRPIRIGRLAVTDTAIRFEDHSLKRPFAAVVGPLAFNLSDFRTVGSRGAPYHFEATTDSGEKLTWSGTLAADPVSSMGEFRVEGLVLAKYSPYFEDRVLADVKDGRLTVGGRYEINLDPSKRTLVLRDGEVHLSGLRVNERLKGGEFLSLPALDVTGIEADAVAMKASVGRVSVSGGHLGVRRNPAGSINLLDLLAAPAAAPSKAKPAPGAANPLPEVAIGEVAVADFGVDVADEAVAHQAHVGLQKIQFSLKQVTLTAGATMPMHLALEWAPKGSLQVDGTVGLLPAPKADLKVSVTGLELLPLSPYVEQFVNARLTQGAVSTASHVTADLRPEGLSLSLEGDTSVDRLGIVDAARDRDLAGFTKLSFSGVKVVMGKTPSAAVREVDVVGPYARVEIGEDKKLNVASIVPPAAPGAAAGPAPAGPLPKVDVGIVKVEGGNFSFLDQSVSPNVAVALQDFGGTVSGLSSENMAKADVALAGKVDGEAPVSIVGKLDPLGARKFVDLKIDFKNVDLLPTSPYLGKYAGYQLARGQLVVDTKVLVDGDKLDTTNVVTLNQFTFGAPTSSPDATALPVRLGVALLKDIDGKIVIDLPVQGSLSDPDFKVGKVVVRVIVNLLTKAAVSPFALVGSMFGGGGDELAFDDFAPGSSELEASDLPKLATLSKALTNRPGLNLGIEGDVDPAADTYALQRLRLEEEVRRGVWKEKHKADPNIPPPDKLQVSAAEHDARVKEMFDRAFPPGTQFGTPLPTPPVVQAPPPPPPPGLFKRMVNLVTFADQRQRRAELKEKKRLEDEHARQVADAVAKGLPEDQMEGRLAEAIKISPDDLAALAASRAQRVRAYLVETAHISTDRLFLEHSQDASKGSKGPRVFLTLE